MERGVGVLPILYNCGFFLSFEGHMRATRGDLWDGLENG